MKEIFNVIKKQTKAGSENEIIHIKETIQNLLTAESDFAITQGIKLLNYLEQLSKGEITKANLKSYMADAVALRDLQNERDELDGALAGRETVDYVIGIVVKIIEDLVRII